MRHRPSEKHTRMSAPAAAAMRSSGSAAAVYSGAFQESSHARATSAWVPPSTPLTGSSTQARSAQSTQKKRSTASALASRRRETGRSSGAVPNARRYGVSAVLQSASSTSRTLQARTPRALEGHGPGRPLVSVASALLSAGPLGRVACVGCDRLRGASGARCRCSLESSALSRSCAPFWGHAPKSKGEESRRGPLSGATRAASTMRSCGSAARAGSRTAKADCTCSEAALCAALRS